MIDKKSRLWPDAAQNANQRLFFSSPQKPSFRRWRHIYNRFGQWAGYYMYTSGLMITIQCMWRHPPKTASWGRISFTLSRHRAYFAASNQGLRYLSLVNIYSEHFVTLCAVSTKNTELYYHKPVKTVDLAYHCVFLSKAVVEDYVTYTYLSCH